MIQGIHAYSVPVRNLDKAITFYTQTVGAGAKIVEAPGMFALVQCKDQKYVLVTDKLPSAPKPGRDAGMVFLVDDLGATINAFKEQGLTPDGPIMEAPNGTKQINYHDPDGNLFSLFQDAR